jgi:3,4-dihydroxy 2-butanone 4-phosphate synthase/GTP cyclohydrolase II
VYTSDVDEEEHLVLVKGEISPQEPVLVRPHAEYPPGDVFSYTYSNTSALLHESMRLVAAEGKGVILYLRQSGQGAQVFRNGGRSGRRPSSPSTSPGSQIRDFRDYGIGAQILRDIGVRKIRLMTNYPRRLVSLPGYGLEIVEFVSLTEGEPERSAMPKRGGRASRASA